jgi:two-component system chemotaxis response regulator CheB
LIAKVRALGAAARRRPGDSGPTEAPALPGALAAAPVRPAVSSRRPQAIVIGASTGGPNALFRLLDLLPRELDVPVFVTQHMPPTFTAILAEHLARHTQRPSHEAENDAFAQPGHVYIAPGGQHMSLVGKPGRVRIVVNDDAAENFCRPSVNPLMRSAARVFGRGALGIMLTGMGTDGLEGARELVAAGGMLIAQDEATSVVWGMPGSVVREGLAAEVLALDDIAAAVARQLGLPQ